MANQTFDKRQAGTYLFILVLAVLFALEWGPGSKGCTRADQAEANVKEAIATVNGKEIPVAEFATIYSNQLRQYRAQGLTAELAKQLGMHKQVVDYLVNSELLAQAAEARGLAASDAELLEVLQKNPDFQKDGAFNPDQYRQVLRDFYRSTDVEYEDKLRRRIAADHLRDLVEAGAVVSEDEVHAKFLKEGNTAKATFVRFSPTAYVSKVPAAKPGQVDAWAKAHEADIAGYYEMNKMSYFQPERAQVRQILIRAMSDDPKAKRDEAKQKIENLKKELDSGKDFAELAKQFSDDTESRDKGGDLGLIERVSLPTKLADAAFALKEGGVTAPVETPLGWHLAKVEKKVPPETKTLDQVRGEIATQLWTREQAKALARADAEKALAAVKSGKSTLKSLYPPEETKKEDDNPFAMLGNSGKTEATETGEFNAGVTSIPQLGAQPELLKAIFDAGAPGTLDKVYEAGDGLAVVVLDARTKPTEEAWAAQKETLTTQAIKGKQFELRESFVKGLKQAGTVVVNDRAIERVTEG